MARGLISARALQVGLAVVIAIAFTGYFAGLGAPAISRAPAPRSIHQVRPADVQPAVTYSELGQVDLGPNRNWHNHLSKLATPQPDPLKEITVTERDKLAALSEREAIRAYNGAPPVIPHPIDQMTAANCLMCHGAGLKIGVRTAPKLSHPEMTNCTQCHVEGQNRDFEPPAPVANSFLGKPAPLAGDRAYAGAPQVIPHTTFMRDNCLSCHGPLGRFGVRSTHPWRLNCTQCHAPSAELDQRIGLVGGPPVGSWAEEAGAD